ncbi:MAG: glycosyltransferase family 4 protein [Pseudomonadales bacterium]
MKVLVIYQYYQDRTAPGHSLVYELTQHLAECGHEVTVVSGETGYMDPQQPTIPWHRRLVRREVDGNVTVIRTYTYSELHRSYLGRLLSFISFSLTSPFGLLLAGRHDVALASSPPIFPVFIAWLFCRIRRIPFVLEVRDLWPDSAVQMGILKNRHLIAIMRWMERKLYDGSKKIIALTQGIHDDICRRGWSRDKVELVTCGVDSSRLYPDENARSATRERFNWNDRTVVLYFGALGEANNIPVILRAAKRLETSSEFLFVLVGNGMKRDETARWMAKMQIKNIQLLPPVPKEHARAYINAADICLATLRDIPLFDGAIPTKMIDYMACSRPVLCGIRGEAQQIIESSGAGLSFVPDSDEQLAEQLLELAANPGLRQEMGAKGLEFVQQRFSAGEMREHAENTLQQAADPEYVKVANGC